MNIFNEVNLMVTKKQYFEVLQHHDRGNGFHITLDVGSLTKLQEKVINFLIDCQAEKLLGTITIVFHSEAVGHLEPLTRRVESIEESADGIELKAYY